MSSDALNRLLQRNLTPGSSILKRQAKKSQSSRKLKRQKQQNVEKIKEALDEELKVSKLNTIKLKNLGVLRSLAIADDVTDLKEKVGTKNIKKNCSIFISYVN
jgi:hypothetical protein